jgi:hypothetical protein
MVAYLFHTWLAITGLTQAVMVDRGRQIWKLCTSTLTCWLHNWLLGVQTLQEDERKVLQVFDYFGAGRGGGLLARIDSKQVIENTRRSKLSIRRKRGS